MSRVYLTGSSVILGGLVDISALWQAQQKDLPLQSRTLTEKCYKEILECSDDEIRILSEHQLMALAAVENAWQNAKLPKNRKPLKGISSTNIDYSFGCVSGTSLGGLMAMQEETARDNWSPTPYSMSRWRGNAIGAAASLRYGLGGCNLSVNAASATGAQALFLAGNLIRSGILARAVVVAADSSVCGHVDKAQKATGAVTTNNARPLDRDRTGMRPVAGAACIILENESCVSARKIKPQVEWTGGVSLSEAYHARAVEPDGKMLRFALNKLVEETCENRNPNIIDWVSLHATGTRAFDPIEISAVRSCFQGHRPWLSAMKRVNGHSLSAAGLIDAALVAYGLQRGELLPWPSNTDLDLALDNVMPLSLQKPKNAILIAQGMGGVLAINHLAKCEQN